MNLLLKTITMLYQEKMDANKDSAPIRIQTLTAFVYDYYINKYGLLNVAERKLKEILITCVKIKKKQFRIEFFSRFIGISDIKYTNDDLNFVFTIATRMMQTTSTAICVKREAAALDVVKEVDLKLASEIIPQLFSPSNTSAMLYKIEDWLKRGQRDALGSDLFYSVLVEKYKEMKAEITAQLGAETNYLTYKEYAEVIKKVKWNDTDGPEVLFNKWAAMTKRDHEIDMMIPVETVAGHIFQKQMFFL